MRNLRKKNKKKRNKGKILKKNKIEANDEETLKQYMKLEDRPEKFLF